MSNEKTIFDFNSHSSQQWQIINDGVMGGLSSSNFTVIDSGYAVFSGEVSPENNGGFASVRTLIENTTINDYDGVMIKVKGDGKIYSIRFRLNRNFDGISYQGKFTADEGIWKIVKIPFTEFIPTFRGRTIPDQPELNSKDIKQLGFLIADNQFGNFNIFIEWIKFYKD
jgi:monofunctional biosynthetic peptidoglycan transglycosylase